MWSSRFVENALAIMQQKLHAVEEAATGQASSLKERIVNLERKGSDALTASTAAEAALQRRIDDLEHQLKEAEMAIEAACKPEGGRLLGHILSAPRLSASVL